MRTTLNIDDELLKQAKASAAREGRTLTSVVENSLRSHCSGGRPRAAMVDPGRLRRLLGDLEEYRNGAAAVAATGGCGRREPGPAHH